MKATVRPMAELNEQAADILIRELGVVDAHRFLSQFRTALGITRRSAASGWMVCRWSKLSLRSKPSGATHDEPRAER